MMMPPATLQSGAGHMRIRVSPRGQTNLRDDSYTRKRGSEYFCPLDENPYQ